VSSNMNLIFLDMEGPLSMQDNTREMMKLFPHGIEIFEIIKRYDNLLAKEGGDYYDPGYGVALVAPFLIHHSITAEDMSQLADRATIVDGARELITSLKRWRAFCVTTSYEQYVARVMQRVGIHLQNVACTRFPIERYRSLASKADHDLVHSIEEELLSLSREDVKGIKSCLDRFFKVGLPKTSFGLAIKEMKPMGGRRKASALRNFARVLGQFPEQVVAVGDSITDSRMLETVDREGGLAVAFNANEHALYYATVGLASTNIGDLKAILNAWEKGGREAVKQAIERANRASAEPKLHWLADSYDREEVLQLHKKVRQQVRQAAGLG
jgi:predicted HAD superfamily phosphohydrolase